MNSAPTIEQPLVSIIVPVYNVEDYLRRCVASIIAQTYTHLEIILIDDGSPDKSGALCDELSKEDSRIKVIHQENQGLSGARNSGLAIAKGLYIAFVDSDDWLHTRYIELLANTLTLHNTDLSECDKLSTPGMVEEKKITVYEPVLLHKEEAIERSLFYGIWGVPYRMFRKSAIGDVRFIEGITAEDATFTFEILSKINKLGVVDEQLYFYFQNPEGITKSEFHTQRMYDFVNASKDIKKIVARENNPNLNKLAARNLGLVCIRQIKEIACSPEKDKDFKHRKWLKTVLLANMYGDPYRVQFLMVKFLPLPLFSSITRLARNLK
ncbi:glycosyltransferase family 2 protein [Maribacter sp. R77961]|uniref:glycosyltransferase family 2 protein n=1 Tax=Maribacter sp. R77961 TaxID=3093871 RepID=UPI0037C656FB